MSQQKKQKPEAAGSNGDVQALGMENDVPVVGPGAPIASFNMNNVVTATARELLDSLYRVDSGRILATLIRLLGDFDLAEEAMREAFAAALDR